MAITERVRSSEGSFADCTIEDVVHVVHNCQWQNIWAKHRKFPQGTHEEVWIADVKHTAVNEDVRFGS